MIIAVAYITFFLITPLVFASFKKRLNVNNTQRKILYVLFVIALAIVAYCIKTPSTWDLSRNYKLLDIIRKSGLSFYQFVFGGMATYIADGYRSLVFYNIYRYIFTHIFNNNAWYQTITTIIVYGIQLFIIYDYNKCNTKNNTLITLIMLLSFSFMPFIYVVSGIRNALAASVMGLAIYLYLYKERKIWPILLGIIAITTHPSVLIVLPFIFLSKMRLGIRGVIWVTIASFGFQLVAILFSSSSVDLLRQIGRSYLLYSGSNQYRGGRGNLYGILILSVAFVFYFIYNDKCNRERKNNKRIDNFLMLILVYMIGNFLNYDLVLRPGYIVGMFAPFLTNVMQTPTRRNIVHLTINIIIILSCVYINYKCFQILIDGFI